jgi:tetratricopeptide (TPR) repeat protein
VPPFADAVTWNRAAFDLESTGQTAAALTAYRSSLRRWQDNEAALLGAGNAAFALGKTAAAANYFYRLSSHSTDHAAAGWNNLAYALKALNCRQAAARAAALAHQLAPGQTAVVDTFNDMTSTDNHSHSETAAEKVQQCQQWQEVIPDVIHE